MEAQQPDQETETKQYALELKSRFGIEIRGSEFYKQGFDKETLEASIKIFENIEKLVGDLKKFSLSLAPLDYFPNGAVHEGADNPLNGYHSGGQVDQRLGEDHYIRIAPKKVLDAYSAWEIKSNLRPTGEGEQIHSFGWTLPHETMHALGVKLGFGYEILASERTEVKQPVKPSSVFEDFIKIDKDIESHVKPLVRDDKGELPNERPEGHPTKYSAEGSIGAGKRFERLADCFAYRATDSHYADNDKWFMERMKFIDHLLDQIKQNKLPVVDEEKYFDEHVLGKN